MKRCRLFDESGLAMITVVMLSTALLLVLAVVFARGLDQYGNTNDDALWEQALAAAESGLNLGLATVEADGGYTTGESLGGNLIGSADEKAWAMAAADAHPSEDVVRTSDGEFVVIKPDNQPYVFAVGYAPARDAADRRVRVVRARFEVGLQATNWTTRLAFLSGDRLDLNGNPTFLTGAGVGVHANGFLDATGSAFADGCLSASGGGHLSGGVNQPAGCPPPGNQSPVFTPEVDPRSQWLKSQYDLCPDGKVRAGPANDTFGNTTTGIPCSGSTLATGADSSPYLGWRFMGCCDASDWATWKYESTYANDGVFYVYQGKAVVVSSPGAALLPWEVTILAESLGSSCGGLQGGDIDIQGHPVMKPYHTTGNLQLLAGRDIDIAGNADISGLTAAHEQIEVTGDMDVTDGSLLAQSGYPGFCDTPGSPVSSSYVGGSATVDNHGPLATELTAPEYVLISRSWVEL